MHSLRTGDHSCSNWNIRKRVATRLGTLGKRVARSSWGIAKQVTRSSWGIAKRAARARMIVCQYHDRQHFHPA